MKKVAIVLVNYNQYLLTIDCIKSIQKSEYKDYSIIVVDNNSDQENITALKRMKNIIFIESRKNLGFSYGCNIGIKYAIVNKYEYVLLLNNDTVIEKTMIQELVKNCNSQSVCLPKMFYYDQPNQIWYAGGKIDWFKGNAIHCGLNKNDSEVYNYPQEINYVTGCCILIPINVFHQVGLLDEIFFMYCEDFDFSLRLLNNKIKMMYVPSAKLWHKVGSSSKNNSKLTIYYSTRNRLYILKKYKFSFIAKLYVFFANNLKYIYGILFNKNEKIIGRALQDYRHHKMGKVDL